MSHNHAFTVRTYMQAGGSTELNHPRTSGYRLARILHERENTGQPGTFIEDLEDTGDVLTLFTSNAPV